MPDSRPRTAVVTGAGSPRGIGFAVAQLLGRHGDRVVITATTDRIRERADRLRAEGIPAIGVVADLTTDHGVADVLAAAGREFGDIDVLVNNAGMTSLTDADEPAPIDEISLAQWQASLDRNLTTAFRMVRGVLPGMMARSFGRVVNVASVSGPVAAYPGDVAYHAAKAGMVGLTRAVAIDAAASGVTINAVAPGWIDTGSATDHERRMGAATPIGRPGTPAEVAHAIAFLAADAASYITGQLVVVDGANTIAEERER